MLQGGLPHLQSTPVWEILLSPEMEIGDEGMSYYQNRLWHLLLSRVYRKCLRK